MTGYRSIYIIGQLLYYKTSFHNSGRPFLDNLFGDVDEPHGGCIDEHNFLLGAVRLRLQVSTAAPGGCPEHNFVLVDAHGASCRPVMDTRDTLDTADFVGPASGMNYTYCEDGIFCTADDPDRTDNHLWGYFPGSSGHRDVLGVQGHVIDLPPNDTAYAHEAVVRHKHATTDTLSKSRCQSCKRSVP